MSITIFVPPRVLEILLEVRGRLLDLEMIVPTTPVAADRRPSNSSILSRRVVDGVEHTFHVTKGPRRCRIAPAGRRAA